MGFTEGPTVTPDGLTWVSVTRGCVYRDGSVLARLGGGPNGTALGSDGNLYVTQNGGIDFASYGMPTDEPFDPVPPGVVRVRPDGTFETVLGPEGLVAPNDLAFAGDQMYFTDPGAHLVFDGDMNVVASDFEYPNGIAVGPDGVWVADTARRRVVRLDDGRTVEMPGAGPDGIHMDESGRLYAACTTDMAVHVFEAGRHAGSYMGGGAGLFTNCCMDGDDLIVTSSLAGAVVAFDISEIG